MEWKDLVGKKLLDLNEKEEGGFDVVGFTPRPEQEKNTEPGEGHGTTILTYRPQYGRISFHRVWCTVDEYLKDHRLIGLADYAVLPINSKRLETCFEHGTLLDPPLKYTEDEDGYAITRCKECKKQVAELKAWHKENGLL
jgi:hypothetical protein